MNYLLHKLRLYGYARNRSTDSEPREITITDDEAVALLKMLADHEPGVPGPDGVKGPDGIEIQMDEAEIKRLLGLAE